MNNIANISKDIPLITIIIPVYNAEKRIEQCICSVLSQTYNNFELILINDGSTDNSRIICEKYARLDNRIITIHKENGGVSTARNIGIKQAKGEYICFIDSDDWVDNIYIESFFHNGKLDEDLFIQGIKYFVPRRNQEPIMFMYSKESFILEDNLGFFVNSKLLENGCPVAKLFKKKIIVDNNIYFDENLTLNEDHLFVISYYKYVHKIYLTDAITYHYYSDYLIPSLTKRKHSTEEYLDISNKVIIAFLEFIRRFNEPIQYWSSYFSTLGIDQIIKAIIVANLECNTIYKLNKCHNLWLLHNEYTQYYAPKEIYKYILKKCLNNKSSLCLYIYSFIIAQYFEFINTVKTKIKQTLKY